MKNQSHLKKDEAILFYTKSSNQIHISFSIQSKFSPMIIQVIQIKLLKSQCHQNKVVLIPRRIDKELNKNTRTLKIKTIT